MHLKVYETRYSNNVSRKFFLIFILSTGLMLWQTLCVNGRPASSAQLNTNQNEDGYNYPVPDNPLELPDKTATVDTEATTIPTTIITYEYPDKSTGYEYEVPENPLTLPTKATTIPSDTIATTAASTLITTSGYQYNVPDNPLTLPPRKDATTVKIAEEPKVDVANQVNVDEPTSQNTGYNYPVPDNPLTLPPRIDTTLKPESTPTPQPTTTETTTQNTGYNYPVPDNPLTLPPRAITTPKLEPIPTTLQPTTPKPKVDGGWGAYTGWTSCSVTCGRGKRSRTRTCDNPAPAYGGSECTADGSSDTQTESCNTNTCPEEEPECSRIDCNDKCDDTGDFEPGDDDYPLCNKCCNVCDIVVCKDDCDDLEDFEIGDDDAPTCNKCCYVSDVPDVSEVTCDNVDCKDDCDDPGDFEPGDDDAPLCNKCCVPLTTQTALPTTKLTTSITVTSDPDIPDDLDETTTPNIGYENIVPDNPLNLPQKSTPPEEARKSVPPKGTPINLPPCTLLDYEYDDVEEVPLQIDIRSGEETSGGLSQKPRSPKEIGRKPGITCKPLPPCDTHANRINQPSSETLSSDILVKQRPGIDCIYDYSDEYDYSDYYENDGIIEQLIENDPPPLTTSTHKPTTHVPEKITVSKDKLSDQTTESLAVASNTPSTGVASSDLLLEADPLSSIETHNRTNNIVINCLKMLMHGEEPLEGVNCINAAINVDFSTFDFSTTTAVSTTPIDTPEPPTTDSLTTPTSQRPTSASVTPAKPSKCNCVDCECDKILTCVEMFLIGLDPKPGVNCIHTASTIEYTDIDYLDGEYDTYEDEVEVEEKLNKLLKNMQPQMPDDMMMLNERAMKAMLNDINQVDYDIPGNGKLLDTLEKLSADVRVLTNDGSKSKKQSPIKGRDINLATKLDLISLKKLDLKSILDIARIAEQHDTASSV